MLKVVHGGQVSACVVVGGGGWGEGGWSKETSLQFFLAWVQTSPGIRSLRCMVR